MHMGSWFGSVHGSRFPVPPSAPLRLCASVGRAGCQGSVFLPCDRMDGREGSKGPPPSDTRNGHATRTYAEYNLYLYVTNHTGSIDSIHRPRLNGS